MIVSPSALLVLPHPMAAEASVAPTEVKKKHDNLDCRNSVTPPEYLINIIPLAAVERRRYDLESSGDDWKKWASTDFRSSVTPPAYLIRSGTPLSAPPTSSLLAAAAPGTGAGAASSTTVVSASSSSTSKTASKQPSSSPVSSSKDTKTSSVPPTAAASSTAKSSSVVVNGKLSPVDDVFQQIYGVMGTSAHSLTNAQTEAIKSLLSTFQSQSYTRGFTAKQ
jgi:hypothetical protein